MNKINHISRHRLTLSHVLLSNGINQSVHKCNRVLPPVSKTCMNISQKWIHTTVTNCFDKRRLNNNNNYNNNNYNRGRTEWRPPQDGFIPYRESQGQAPDKVRFHDRRMRTCMFIGNWITDTLKTYEPGKTVINWEELRDEAKEIYNLIDENNFGGILLAECTRREEIYQSNPEECSKEKVFEIGQDFMKWNRKPTLPILAAFMQLCSYNMDKVSEKSLLNMYNSICTKLQGVWSNDLATKVILGILKTSKWKDSIPIKDGCYKQDKSSYLSVTSGIAAKAFEEKEFDLGWSLLSERRMLQNSHYRKSSLLPFKAYLHNCPPTEESVQKLFDHLDLYEIYPDKSLVSSIVNFFEKNLGYKAQATRVHGTTKMCQNCGEPLDLNDLSKEEFQKLQSHFLNNVVLAEDIFMNTTPDELKEYLQFLARYGPFDVVLDALNICHSLQMRTSNPILVESAAYKFSTQGKRTLIIGRRHMNRWPKSVMRNISDTGYLFLIDDQSEDDPFIIYGALKSGPDTIFISKDFMRQHTYGLRNAEIARLFKRWRWTHQRNYFWDRNEEIQLLPVAQILPVPQKNQITETYHIPYSIQELASPYDLPDKWMCIAKRKINRKI